MTSVLESQRHPELSSDEHDSLQNSREFVTWAVNDAIDNGASSPPTPMSAISSRCWSR